MFDNLKNLAELMRSAGQLRQKMEELQAELAKKTVEGNAGAGAVRVVINGRFEVQSVKIDRVMLATLAVSGDPGNPSDALDHQMVEDLITAAIADALTKARELVAQQMGQLTGGMNLPGMEKLLGG